jgi:hypothetical protein
LITIEGRVGIKATILCDSISEARIRFTTMEIEYPRIILSELNTHRMLPKNSASSRAIPFEKMQKQLTGMPVRFGAANPGMRDGGDHDAYVYNDTYGSTPVVAWHEAKLEAIKVSRSFYEAGYSKQIFNRLTEPWQMMKTVISGTEWANFFWLRNHNAADPSLEELARCMKAAMATSTPQFLKAGEWHLPYVDSFNPSLGYKGQTFHLGDGVPISLDDAIKVSCARCAAVSYRNEDYSLAKCIEVYDKLVGSDRKHASAFEHQANPCQKRVLHKLLSGCVNIPSYPSTWEKGISHMDRNEQLWSGPLKGWIQYRKLIDGENHDRME